MSEAGTESDGGKTAADAENISDNGETADASTEDVEAVLRNLGADVGLEGDDALEDDMSGYEESYEEGDEGAAEELLAALRSERDNTKKQLLSALAETENVRRRATKDREDAGRYAIADFARDVVSVADNLERALDSLPKDWTSDDPQVSGMCEGVEMTLRELAGVLEKRGIQRIDPIGEPFDHNFHQAMFEIEDNEKPAGTVVHLVQAGYRIHDRLLRPAQVGVTKRSAAPKGVDTEV